MKFSPKFFENHRTLGLVFVVFFVTIAIFFVILIASFLGFKGSLFFVSKF